MVFHVEEEAYVAVVEEVAEVSVLVHVIAE